MGWEATKAWHWTEWGLHADAPTTPSPDPDGIYHLRLYVAGQSPKSVRALENLRRVWETVSLNVLDGPASPNAAPDAWAELVADAIIGHRLNDSVLARFRPEGFA